MYASFAWLLQISEVSESDCTSESFLSVYSLVEDVIFLTRLDIYSTAQKKTCWNYFLFTSTSMKFITVQWTSLKHTEHWNYIATSTWQYSN